MIQKIFFYCLLLISTNCFGLKPDSLYVSTPEARTEFLTTKRTRIKLQKAEELGVLSPETHYLLGIIYNEGMHWHDGLDNVSPIASELDNLTIKKLITDVFINTGSKHIFTDKNK